MRDMMTDAEAARSRSVDSSDIASEDGGETRPERCTPNGTPLPAGPPPPHAVQAERPMSLAISSAIANALANRGIHARRMLTMVTGPPAYHGELAHSHPNTLWLNDLEEPEEEAPVADETEAILTRRIGGQLGPYIPWADREERTVDSAVFTWGPPMSGPAATSSMATSSTGTTVISGHATAVAPHTPPNYTDRDRGGATAKPTNRKCETQLCLCVTVSDTNMWQHSQLVGPHNSYVSRSCSGDATVIACHRSTDSGRTRDKRLVVSLATASVETSHRSPKNALVMAR